VKGEGNEVTHDSPFGVQLKKKNSKSPRENKEKPTAIKMEKKRSEDKKDEK
jgi:hypothetical protein